MTFVLEGHIAVTHAQEIVYPEVSTCLTITCVGTGGLMAGGHAVLNHNPAKGQKPFDEIVKTIKAYVPKKERSHLLFIGCDLEFWENQLSRFGYMDLGDIEVELEMQGKSTKFDTLQAAPRGTAVDVVVKPTGVAQIYKSHTELREWLRDVHYALLAAA